MVAQINHDGGEPRAVLHRRRAPLWKRRSGRLATPTTAADVGAMLDHDQRLWLRQVKNLPGAVRRGHVRRQGRLTTRAVVRIMVEDVVRRGDLAQGCPRMALSPAGWLARCLA